MCAIISAIKIKHVYILQFIIMNWAIDARPSGEGPPGGGRGETVSKKESEEIGTEKERASRLLNMLDEKAADRASHSHHEKAFTREESNFIKSNLHLLDLKIREPFYRLFPEFAVDRLGKLVGPVKEPREKSVSKAYNLLSQQVTTKSNIVFNDEDWRTIEEAWPHFDLEVQMCAEAAFPEFFAHALRASIAESKAESQEEPDK